MSAVHRRRRGAGLVVLLACLATAFVPSPARAADGLFTQILCTDPATGTGVIAAGLLPDGMSAPSHYTAMSGAEQNARCGAEGIRIEQGASTSSASTGAALNYRAGAVRFRSAVVYRSWSGSEAWGLFVNRGVWENMWTSPWDDRCSSHWAYNCTSRGSSSARFGSGNRVELSAGTEATNGFNLAVLCDASPGTDCKANSAQGLRFYGGTVTLEDDVDPQVAGVPSGALFEDAVAGVPLRGVRDLSIAAADVGAGVYRVKLLLDDALAQSRVVNDNGGRCADARPADDDAYQFLHRQPCRSSASADMAFDTTALDEGRHNLKLQLEDAAGNSITVLNRTVTVDNIAAPSFLGAPQVNGSPRSGSSLSVTPGIVDDHGASGDPVVSRVWQRCRADGSQCSDIAGADGVTYTVGDADLNRTLRVVETAVNAEGSTQSASALTQRVTRADGTLPADNDGVDNDGDGVVDEAGETVPATGPSSPGTSGSSVVSTPGVAGAKGADGRDGAAGVTTTMSSVGQVNGENASPRAVLTAQYSDGRTTGTLVYGKTLVVRGRLVDESGRPIRNAIVDVAETPALVGARAASGTPSVTDSTGAFTYRVSGKAGSRSVTFVYRYQRQGAVVAQAALGLKVRAGVKLAVKLKGVIASYSGRVLAGAMPRGGKLVIVQGRAKGGSWQTFASRRAGKSGTFKGRYRLKVRRPGKQLQFRVRVLSESGWNFGAVTSKAVTRKVK